MHRLYQKNELYFALIWVAIYCAVMTPLRGQFGDESPVTVLALVAMAAMLRLWIHRHGLTEKYGLGGFPRNGRRYLYFLPIGILATGNLWGGFALSGRGLAQVLATLSMILFAYLEELIFRGLLLEAMLPRSGVRKSIIVVAVTFGIGHILNLFTGQAGMETVVQILFAVAWGFLFTLIFYKSGSLWPSILAHALINASSRYAVEEPTAHRIFIIATILSAVVYGSYLWKLEDKKSAAGAIDGAQEPDRKMDER